MTKVDKNIAWALSSYSVEELVKCWSVESSGELIVLSSYKIITIIWSFIYNE